jgi:hypothetical protein
MKNDLSKYKILRWSVSVSKEIWIQKNVVVLCENIYKIDYTYFVVLWKSLPRSKQIRNYEFE